MNIILFLVALMASIVGAICGIGGGVIVKPVLDMLSIASISTISFLSSCMVLSMSLYSILQSFINKSSKVDVRRGTPLAIGAIIGGILGNGLFEYVKGISANQNQVGAIQAICLALITFGALLYTLFRNKIKAKNVQSIVLCIIIGCILGIMSSFLGIGGGPINLVVLYFFFSMDTKVAAQNSLYIILFGQASNLIAMIVNGSIPTFEIIQLCLMIIGGILGGISGKIINKKIDSNMVQKLFIGFMIIIIFISCFNFYKFV